MSSETTRAKHKTARSPTSTSLEQQLRALPIPVQDLSFLQPMGCDSDPSHPISSSPQFKYE